MFDKCYNVVSGRDPEIAEPSRCVVKDSSLRKLELLGPGHDADQREMAAIGRPVCAEDIFGDLLYRTAIYGHP